MVLDGPYGKNLDTSKYQTILLVTHRRGIFGILPFALSILSGRNQATQGNQGKKTYKNLNKLDIFWKLGNLREFQWALEFFRELEEIRATQVSGTTFPDHPRIRNNPKPRNGA